MKPRSLTTTPALSAPILRPFGVPSDRLQDQVIALRFCRRSLAFEADPQSVGLGVDAHGLGLQHDLVEACLVTLLPDLHEVAVGAQHQAVQHFDDVDPRTQRRVHGRHFESDDASAHHEHLLRHVAQFERAGGVDHARIVRHERQPHGGRSGRDDGLAEADHLLVAGLVLRIAGREFHFEMVGAGKAAVATHDRHLAHLRHRSQAAGQLADDLALVRTQLVQAQLRRAELDAEIGEVRGFVHDRRHVQQCLRRDAADIQAHATERGIALDQHDLLAEVCRAERG